MICHTRFAQLLQKQLPKKFDWLWLLLMAYTVPFTAALIHSVYVFHRGTRLYQAEIGGPYIDDLRGLDISKVPILNYFFLFLIWSCIITVLPFLILWFFRRKRDLYRWIVWIVLTALWTWFDFATAVVLK